jgi:hypothetical protein
MTSRARIEPSLLAEGASHEFLECDPVWTVIVEVQAGYSTT